jgi:hypothetical protein
MQASILLGHRKEFIRKLFAQNFSILIRKLPATQFAQYFSSFFDIGIRIYSENMNSKDNILDGLAHLCINTITMVNLQCYK